MEENRYNVYLNDISLIRLYPKYLGKVKSNKIIFENSGIEMCSKLTQYVQPGMADSD